MEVRLRPCKVPEYFLGFLLAGIGVPREAAQREVGRRREPALSSSPTPLALNSQLHKTLGLAHSMPLPA